MHSQLCGALSAFLVTTLALPGNAQDRFATSVVSFNQGTGSGIFDPSQILGGPRGAGLGNGSLDVLSLGVGGDVTLAFDVTITDGPGADFSVFENGFLVGGEPFTEVCLIEVSTNGVDFARYPSRYHGPQGPQGAFGTLAPGTFSGVSGTLPILTNVITNNIDPFDPVVSGGESFDLAELAGHALVQQGLVDLDEIHFVRLVDVPEGTILDSAGFLIWDNGGPNSGADMDAVAVIQHLDNQDPGAPTVDLYLDAMGFAHCILADPNGLGDLDWTTLSMSINLNPAPFQRLRDFFTLQSSSPMELHLVSPIAIPGSAIQAVLSVSVKDLGGLFSGDQLSMHP